MREVPGVNVLDVIYRGYRITSRNRRPLFERQAPQSVIDLAAGRGVSTELTTDGGIYGDSRDGTLVNHSARLAIADHYRPMLNGLVWINNHYFAGVKPHEVKVGEMSELLDIATALPAYLVFTTFKPFKEDNHLSDEIASAAKAAFGASMLISILKKPEFNGLVPEPERLYRLANDEGLLVRGGQSCAAPKEMMIPTFAALIFGIGGNPAESILAERMSTEDFENLKLFSDAYTAAMSRDRRFRMRMNESQFGLSENEWEVFLLNMNILQRTMNKALGRGSARMPTENDMTRVNKLTH